MVVGQFDLLTSKWNDDLNHLELNNGNSKKGWAIFFVDFPMQQSEKKRCQISTKIIETNYET